MTTKGAIESLTDSDILLLIPELKQNFLKLSKSYQSKIDNLLNNPNLGGINGLKLLLLDYKDDPILKDKISKAIELERYVRGKMPVYQFSFNELHEMKFVANKNVSDILNNKAAISFADFLQLVRKKHALSIENEALSEHNNALFAELNLLKLEPSERKNHPLTLQSNLLSSQMKIKEKEKEEIVLKIKELGEDFDSLAHFIECYLILETLETKLASLAFGLSTLEEIVPKQMDLATEENEDWSSAFATSEMSLTSGQEASELSDSDHSDKENLDSEEDWDSQMGFADSPTMKPKLHLTQFALSLKQLQITEKPAQNDNAAAAAQPDTASKVKSIFGFPAAN